MRQQKRGDNGIVAVGIGRGIKRGQPDPLRTLVVHYFVRRKRGYEPKHPLRIPPSIRFSLSRGKKRIFKTLPTDVIQTNRPKPTATEVDCGRDYFSAGYVVRYTTAAGVQWALLGVGHGILGGASIVQVPALRGARKILCTTVPNDTLDACLIQLLPGDLVLLDPTIDSTPAAPALPCLQVADAARNTGQYDGLIDVCPRSGNSGDITIHSLIGFNYGMIPELPNLHNLVYATANNAFNHGTSGGPWLAYGPPAVAMQTAADPSTDYSTGYGQLLPPIFDWAAGQLGVVAGTSIDLIGWA